MNEVVEQGCNVVLVGSFNPTIFTPHWLAYQGIISKEDADKATVEVVHREVARIGIPGLKFDVTPERCHLIAEAEPFIRLVDIVAQLFTQALPHTPISALGVNYHVHCDLQDWEKRVRFGRMLVPPEVWGQFGSGFDADDIRELGGLIDLTVQQPRRVGPHGFTRATIQPSAVVANNTGIFIQVNNHYGDEPSEQRGDVASLSKKRARTAKKPVEPVEPPMASNSYPSLLVEHFESAIVHSKEIVAEMIEKAENS